MRSDGYSSRIVTSALASRGDPWLIPCSAETGSRILSRPAQRDKQHRYSLLDGRQQSFAKARVIETKSQLLEQCPIVDPFVATRPLGFGRIWRGRREVWRR